MAELWLALPEPIQAILLICKTGSSPWQKAADGAVAEILSKHQKLCAATEFPDTVVKHAITLAEYYALAGPWIRTPEDLFWALNALDHIFVLQAGPLPVEAPERDKETMSAIQEALKRRTQSSWTPGPFEIPVGSQIEAASRLDAVRAVLRKMSPQARESLPRELIVLLPLDDSATMEPNERKRKIS